MYGMEIKTKIKQKRIGEVKNICDNEHGDLRKQMFLKLLRAVHLSLVKVPTLLLGSCIDGKAKKEHTEIADNHPPILHSPSNRNPPS